MNLDQIAADLETAETAHAVRCAPIHQRIRDAQTEADQIAASLTATTAERDAALAEVARLEAELANQPPTEPSAEDIPDWPSILPTTLPDVMHAPGEWVFPDDQQGASDTAQILAAAAKVKGSQAGIAFRQRPYDLRQPIPAHNGIALCFVANPGPKLAMLEPDPVGIHTNYTGAVLRATGDITGAYVGNVVVHGLARGRLWDQAAGILAAAMFESNSLYGCAGGIGNDTAAVAGFQWLITGHWQAHGFRQTPFRLKGAEVHALGLFLNADAPTDVAGNGRPIWWNDQLEKSDLEGLYLTGRNGWVPFRQSGNPDRMLNSVTRSKIEGYKANSPSTVPAVQMQGGGLTLDHVNINYVAPPAQGFIDHTAGHVRVGAVGVKYADAPTAPGYHDLPLFAGAGTSREVIGTPVGYGAGQRRTVKLAA